MTIEQLKELKDKLAVLRRYLDVDNRVREIEDLTAETLSPTFWNDPKRAEGIQRKIGLNKKWVDEYHVLAREVDDLEGLFEFQKEGLSTEEEVEAQYRKTSDLLADAEFRSTLNKKEDAMNAVLQINAGAGGTEACDWASMLLRMYRMWADKNGFKVNDIFEQDGDAAGIKSASIEIVGDYAYGWLKGENGVHRLVRVSPFNAQGKRQTSFSSVFVYPLVEDDDIEIVISPDDLRWDVFRASGAGGQHVNRTESAVRVTHIPTGIVAECQQDRSQHRNREIAMTLLKSRLYQLEMRKREEEKAKVEAGKNKIEWGSQIRSYVLDDRWVKDLRTGYKVHNPDAVLDGDLQNFLKAYLMWESNPTEVETEED
ncbi:MAG TPA: peptide chain release factor 2 [Saprospiraceae bacterium]|nr:peptide chain release factor 2 [Saprospiraceae bacterium]HNM24205.1 peptide chain release factor 2 [Saprospiraceae bacterium]